MANRYWLQMWCTISVVILGSFIHSGQTLECYWCVGESCNQVSKDTQIINCTELNSNPLNQGNITTNTNDTNSNGNGTTTNGTNTNGNGTQTNGTNTVVNGTDTSGNGTNTNTTGNGTNTNGTNTTGNGTTTNGTNTVGNKTFGIYLENDEYGYNDDEELESREKRNAEPNFYATPVFKCLKVVSSDKKQTMRRCAESTFANNVSDACNTYTGLNSSQASCYLCDKDQCNAAYLLKAPVASSLVISSLLLCFHIRSV